MLFLLAVLLVGLACGVPSASSITCNDPVIYASTLDDLKVLQSCGVLEGSLFVSDNGNSSDISVLSLPNLTSINGTLNITSNATTVVQLPQLVTVTNSIQIGAPISSLDISALTNVQNLELGNTNLTSFVGTSYLSINQELEIYSNNMLSNIDFGAVRIIGSIFVSNNTALSQISFASLTKTNGIFINGSDSLTDLTGTFPSLQLVGSGGINIRLNSLTHWKMDQLTEVDADFIVVSNAIISCSETANYLYVTKGPGSYLSCGNNNVTPPQSEFEGGWVLALLGGLILFVVVLIMSPTLYKQLMARIRRSHYAMPPEDSLQLTNAAAGDPSEIVVSGSVPQDDEDDEDDNRMSTDIGRRG